MPVIRAAAATEYFHPQFVTQGGDAVAENVRRFFMQLAALVEFFRAEGGCVGEQADDSFPD